MKTKRILAFLLAMVMMISLVPTFTFTASAATTEKNVMLGTAALSEYDSTNGYDYIYYGTYDSRPIKWRILSMNGNSGTYTDGDGNPVVSSNAMFMLSEYALKKMAYDADKKANSGQTYPNNWRYSDIWNWCNNTSNNTSFISSSFTPSEKAYLLKTSKSNTSSPATDELNADTFFLLSEKEVGQVNDRIAKMASDPSGAVVWWWIRSPNNNRNLMNIVYKDGTVMCTDVNSTKVAARPAFNLNMGSILFTVPAKNGKSTTSGLQKTTEYTGTDYKLTIKDSSRGFKITNAPQSITTDADKPIIQIL